jgi:hypothetical protein
MITKLLANVVAGALLIPAAALGKDATVATQLPSSQWKSAVPLPLPPIPYFETIPLLTTEATGPRQKVDQLLGPDFETLKFALDKERPLTTRYSSMPRGTELGGYRDK